MRAKGVRTKAQKGPFGLYMEKIVDVKFFGIFKKKPQQWPTQDLSNIERYKVMKNQFIRGIPRGLAYDNQPGGVDLTPPMQNRASVSDKPAGYQIAVVAVVKQSEQAGRLPKYF